MTIREAWSQIWPWLVAFSLAMPGLCYMLDECRQSQRTGVTVDAGVP